ncbi:MAG: hypothetical protein B7Z61_05980 [Acidobacteria bacterium 37-71-11]|nr:MAG: hypothetical protein B7Z61_05980 [Acidobacteria bacterium 37-71-11]
MALSGRHVISDCALAHECSVAPTGCRDVPQRDRRRDRDRDAPTASSPTWPCTNVCRRGNALLPRVMSPTLGGADMTEPIVVPASGGLEPPDDHSAAVSTNGRSDPTPGRVAGSQGATQPRHDGLRTVLYGVLGFVFGFAVLHPVSMIIFSWFDPRLSGSMTSPSESILAPFFHAFQPGMAPMGLVFGLFSAGIAVIDGIYRLRLTQQRDRLAAQLLVNRRYRNELLQQASLLRRQNERLSAMEEANRRHTRFMVHDFKGHLQTILGFSEVLLSKVKPEDDPSTTDALRRIRQQANKMSGAVMDLLEFSRLRESPQVQLRFVEVEPLVRESAADGCLPTHLGSVEVGPTSAGCIGVMADPDLLRRVLVNLAANALKHNRPGTRVVLDAAATPQGEVVFSCTDDGLGVPPEVERRLFRDFARGDRSVDHESTGLGLAFCKAAVEAHGGRIWYESPGSQGARFLFTIPSKRKELTDV